VRGLQLAVACIPCIALAATALKVSLKPGSTVGYRVSVSQLENRNDGNTGASNSSTHPVRIDVLAANRLRIETGPLFAMGRSVGRSKVRESEIAPGGFDKGKPPVMLFVLLPPSGVQPGQKWSAPFSAPAPIPGGLSAQYQYVKPAGKFAEVALTVKQQGSTRVTGSGKLYLRLSDGMLDNGSAKFVIEYLRPDMQNPGQTMVNSRTVAEVKITQR
jgi:hypothetical protein